MGRIWLLEREFEYSLNPEDTYIDEYTHFMRREWNYRVANQHNLEIDTYVVQNAMQFKC